MGHEDAIMTDDPSEWPHTRSRYLDLLPGLCRLYWGFGESLDAVARSCFLMCFSGY